MKTPFTHFTPLSTLPPRAAAVAHSHFMRNSKTDFDTCVANLVAWVRARGVKALGVGSPWGPNQAAAMRRCEHEDRDAYYAGRLTDDFLFRDEMDATLAALSRACPDVNFFLDNETPKNRYGHLWYIGYEPVVPGWHDYSQDRRVAFSEAEAGDPSLDQNPLTGKAHIRRPYAEVVAEQRARGALAVWAHPTSWWLDPGDVFVTNIAADMPAQLLMDGGLDGITVMGYDAFHRHYQALWFAILDMGYRVPGLAEQDCSPAGSIIGNKADSILNYIPDCAGTPTVAEFKDAVRDFRTTMSSGPDLRLLSLRAEDGLVYVNCLCAPAPGESRLSKVEILGRGGKVRATLEGAGCGTAAFAFPLERGDTWFVARCFGETCGDYASKPQQAVRVMALTNPLWLDAAPPPPAPVATSLPYMENARVRKLMDYLADGHFRADWPGLLPGEVPAEAFRFAEFRDALENPAPIRMV
jgi:hypothetical protein